MPFFFVAERVESVQLSDRKWRAFLLTGNKGLFPIVSTNTGIDAVRLKVNDDESVPYITRTELLNGIAKFVSKENLYFGKDSGGCITIGLDTQTAYWQMSDFITGQNIQILRSNLVNLYSGLFLTVVLKKQMKAKFNWGGNGATLGRLKKLKIMLPVTDTGEPDYQFMEDYIKELILKKYFQYLIL